MLLCVGLQYSAMRYMILVFFASMNSLTATLNGVPVLDD